MPSADESMRVAAVQQCAVQPAISGHGLSHGRPAGNPYVPCPLQKACCECSRVARFQRSAQQAAPDLAWVARVSAVVQAATCVPHAPASPRGRASLGRRSAAPSRQSAGSGGPLAAACRACVQCGCPPARGRACVRRQSADAQLQHAQRALNTMMPSRRSAFVTSAGGARQRSYA